MLYDLEQRGDQFFYTATGACAGYVVPQKGGKTFAVHRAMTDLDERSRIGVASTMKEALETLTDYYVHNWPKWRRIRKSQFVADAGYTMYTAHIKWSFYGVFTVKQREHGRWVASRYTEKLLRDGEEATFPTAEVARYVVDRHEYQGILPYPVVEDGYSWEDYPHLPGRCQTNGDTVSFF